MWEIQDRVCWWGVDTWQPYQAGHEQEGKWGDWEKVGFLSQEADYEIFTYYP